MAEDRQLDAENIELTGRMVTSVDPTQLVKGMFQDLSNMRYTDTGIRSVSGMTKINSSALAKPTIGCGVHFVKDQPAESHLLVQGIAGDGSSAIYDNTTAIPSAGNFSGTTVFTETSNADHGTFSFAPDGCIAYSNSKDLAIWGGNESRCAGFIVTDKDDTSGNTPTKLWDYTSQIADFNTTTVAVRQDRYIHIASTRALKGVKFYVGTANASACTVSVKYWKSDGTWAAVSGTSDGTSVGGKSLAQTGTISFTSTVGSANLRYFNNTLAYWYLFDFNGADVATTIYSCKVDAPMQAITDLWDGSPRQIASFQIYTTLYGDYSSRVYAQDYVDGATSTYVDLGGITTSMWCVVGFTERMRGIKFNFVPRAINLLATVMKVYYWSGSAWVETTGLIDKTSSGGISLAQSGVAYWVPPSLSSEFTTSITEPDLFYYYKIQWTTNPLSGSPGVYLDSIFGIPASSSIETYKFPTMFQNRLVLCNNQSDENNSILIGSANTNCVFNGTDTVKLFFGDDREINCAMPFFSRFSNSFFENLFVGKPDSVWIVDGITPGTYRPYKISNMYGVTAPKTLTACDLGFASGAGTNVARNIIIWQSSSHICIWEGSVVIPIDADILDVFDQTNSNSIEPTMIGESTGFFDEDKNEWHWLWASKGNTTSLDMEYVYDVIRKKWFKINRGTGKKIQLGIPVIDSNNNRYAYGTTTDGYVERLEYGTTFDSNSIVSYFRTGDIPLGGWMLTTSIRHLKPILKAKSTTTNQMQLTYYGDTATTSTATLNFNVNDSTHRLVQTQANKPNVTALNYGDFIFHSFKCSMTTTNENIGFEPIGLGILYHKIRQEVK